MNCSECKNQHDTSVPYVAYEGELSRMERMQKRLITAVIMCVLGLIVSNALWLWAWMQYDYIATETCTVTVDGADGTALYQDGEGNVINSGMCNQNQDDNESKD